MRPLLALGSLEADSRSSFPDPEMEERRGTALNRASTAAQEVLELPQGKKYHYFLSHKKFHSKLGGVPEQVAKNLHDSLELSGLVGFFDIDDLLFSRLLTAMTPPGCR